MSEINAWPHDRLLRLLAHSGALYDLALRIIDRAYQRVAALLRRRP